MTVVAQIADQLSAMDGLDRRDRYVEALRVAKIVEEAGEAMQALIAYHDVNPRKPAGTLRDVIKELCDVALTAKVAMESFGFDADVELAARERAVLTLLREAA
jgi:NTP pyrophosphatase (non-canonical NTP hydrolase)